MKTSAAKPAVTIATLSLAWSIGTALPAVSETRTDISRTAPSALALGNVPRPYLTWYQRAAQTCPGLGWPVLAGIGEVESDHGQSPLPGVHSAANFAGAEGPMQFEPRTFAAFAVRADPRHALSVYDPEDAIFTAARMLCTDGADGGTPQGIATALFAYNHADWYRREVLSWAARYASDTPVVIRKTVVIRRTEPVAPEHIDADHHHDRLQPAQRSGYVHPARHAHPAPAAEVAAHSDHTEAAGGNFGAEAEQLAAEAGQLASEAHQLSGEAQQLTAEAHQLSSEAQQSSPPGPQPAASASSSAQPAAAAPSSVIPAVTPSAPTLSAPTAPASAAPAPASPAAPRTSTGSPPPGWMPARSPRSCWKSPCSAGRSTSWS